MTDIRSTSITAIFLVCALFWCSSGTQQGPGLTAAASHESFAAQHAGSFTGCPEGVPIMIYDTSKPVFLLPNTNYQFLAGRFVLATTLTMQPGQSCCITGTPHASTTSSRTILLPPKPAAAAAAAGNSTARQQLHFNLTGGFLLLRNLTVSGYTGGSSRGGGGVLIQRAAGGGGPGEPPWLSASLMTDNVTFSHISPRAVANIDDTAAAINLNHTSFVSNNHSGVTCYDEQGGMVWVSWHNFKCFVPNDAAGAAGLSTVSNVTFWGATRFVGNTWGALHSKGTRDRLVWMEFNGQLLLMNNNKSVSDFTSIYDHPLPEAGNASVMSMNGAGIWATHTAIAIKGGTIISANNQSAVYMNASTAKFSSLRMLNNQAKNAVLVFVNSSVIFADRVNCSQDANPLDLDPRVHVPSTTCVLALESTLRFNESARFSNSVQDVCANPSEYQSGWWWEPEVGCWDVGGAAIACLKSNITVMGTSVFSRNLHRGGSTWEGTPPGWSMSGGAIHLDHCNYSAHKATQFVNNSADGYVDLNDSNEHPHDGRYPGYLLQGGALSASYSSASFEGLDVIGNKAATGGGVHLCASVLTLKGGRFNCIGNAAACDGTCMYVGYGSSVLMNSSTSCITGNTDIGNSSSSTSSSSSSELATVPYDCDAHGPVLGAIFISGNSSVHFIGHAHRMGSNQGNGSNADIVVFSPPVEPERLRRGVPAGQSKSTFDTLRAARGMTQSKAQAVPPQRADQVQGLGNFNGFACDDKDAHTDGVYMMAGDVCGCDGNCTCQPPTQWIAGRCACV